MTRPTPKPDSTLSGAKGQEEVRAIISAIAPLSGGHEVAAGATLTDLGFDSVDLIELAVRLEERFGVDLGNDRTWQATNVEEIVSLVIGLAANMGQPHMNAPARQRTT